MRRNRCRDERQACEREGEELRAAVVVASWVDSHPASLLSDTGLFNS